MPDPADDAGSEVREHFAHLAVLHTVMGVAIRYRLTIDGPEVEYVDSERDRSMPQMSCRLSTADGAELLVLADEWVGRLIEVDQLAREWITSHVRLTGTRMHQGRTRRDPEWMRAWRMANPSRA